MITQKKQFIFIIAATILMVFAMAQVTSYAANYPEEISVGYRDSEGTSHSVTLTAEKPCFINGNPEPQASTENANATYDPSDHTLILNGYEGTGIDERSGSGDLIIFVRGNNVIDSQGNNAINIPGDIQIHFMNGGKLTINDNFADGSSFGIRTNDGDVIINGTGTLDITANSTRTDSSGDAHGIYGGGDVTISDRVKVTID